MLALLCKDSGYIFHSTGLGETGDPKPTLLLVGDSNATGYCETQPYKKSLRCRLAARFAVTLGGKSGTSWKRVAQSVKDYLQESSGRVVSEDLYTYILVVFGTNDIPKMGQWAKQERALQEAMENVLAGLVGYLSPTGLGGLLVT